MGTQRTIAFVGHRYHLEQYTRGLYDALGQRFDIRFTWVDDGWPESIADISGHDEADACIWFVRFRELIERPGFRWGDFAGVRVMLEHDAVQNFAVSESRYIGAWPEVFHRNDFQVLASSGKATSERLAAAGVPSYWLPKGYDAARMFDLDLERNGIGYYGMAYQARRAMLDYLQRRRVGFTSFRCQSFELNEHLNQFLGCLICNMEGIVGRGLGRVMHRLSPSRGLVLKSGLEPMIKNFEVPGAGCAPICDEIDELADLGFADGDTMVSYRTFDELVEKLDHYGRAPEDLREIGRRGNTLVQSRHTWDDRAEQLEDFIARQMCPTPKIAPTAP
ncbi:MAG: glycosyltransferase [Acidimicrobiia bacterium]